MSLTDETILYQLEKVDQGGAISDILEEYTAYVAKELGLTVNEEPEHPCYGMIELPDGRHAYLQHGAVIE